MSRRTIVALAFCIVLTFAATPNCVYAQQKPIVLLLLKTQSTKFFQDIAAGAERQNAKLGEPFALHVRAGSREGDVTGQRLILESFYADYVDGRQKPLLAGVLLTPAASGSELVPQIKRLRARGIPVILLDTAISKQALATGGTNVTAVIVSDNISGGRDAADIVMKALKGNGRVLLLNGVDGQETAAHRRDGFVGRVAELRRAGRTRLTIDHRTCNWSRNEARSTVDGLLSFGARYNAIFAANDEMALGAIEALRQHPTSPLPKVIVGFDAIPDARAAVQAGSLTATMEQQPALMGERGIAALHDVRERRSLRDLVIPVKAVTKR